MGGSPLNNDVWYTDISSIRRVPRTTAPLTRAFYLNYTYSLSWQQAAQAPWSPRCGFGATAQWYFNETTQNISDGAMRLVVIGGYGGWLDQTGVQFPYTQQGAGVYDGVRTRRDVWSMNTSGDWVLLNSNPTFLGIHITDRQALCVV
jgi:hypothetical protein